MADSRATAYTRNNAYVASNLPSVCQICVMERTLADRARGRFVPYEYRITPSSTVPKRSVTMSSA